MAEGRACADWAVIDGDWPGDTEGCDGGVEARVWAEDEGEGEFTAEVAGAGSVCGADGTGLD